MSSHPYRSKLWCVAMVSGAMWITQIGCSQTEACLDENGDQTLCDDVAPDLGADMSADASPSSMDMRPSREDADMLDPVLPDGGTDMKDMTPSCEPRSMEAACNGVCGQQPDGCGAIYDCGMPLTQEQACAGACGMQSDGCGAMIECEPCACENGQPLEPRCGVCQLGRSTCDGDTFSCDVYTIPGLDAATDCDASIVHVNARSMAQTPDGSRAAPFTNLAEATLAASERSARVILVGGSATDEYSEVLEIKDGISVVGGWDVDWYPDPTRIPIIKPLPGDVPADIFGARANDVVDRDTLVAHLSIETPDVLPSTDGPGHHNYGLYARNASKLVLESVNITAGRGGDGADGADGENGDQGSAGPDGQVGLYSDMAARINYPRSSCASTGGPSPVLYFWGYASDVRDRPKDLDGFFYPAYFASGYTEPVNQTCNTGVGIGSLAWGGAGGFAGRATGQFDIVEGKDGRENGEGLLGGSNNSLQKDGLSGSSLTVAKASDGSGGKVGIVIKNGLFAYDDSLRAQNGVTGRHGNGGSGGAGADQEPSLTLIVEHCGDLPLFNAPCTERCLHEESFSAAGPSGGAGGNGGCGGEGGQRGSAGGASIGMFFLDSNDATVRESTVFASQGGDGGIGGTGGAGGVGGAGGAGTANFCKGVGTRPCVQVTNVKSGSGGDGSTGQKGGIGGSGAGGSSYGVYCAQSSIKSDAQNVIKANAPGSGGRRLDGLSGEDGWGADIQGCN